MGSENYYEKLDLKYPEIAIAAETFYTTDSSAKFYIPILMPMIGSSSSTSTTRIPPNTNILNKNRPSITSTASSSGSISIPLRQERLGYFYKNIVPRGTKFIVIFIGGDINNPAILGRY